MRILRTLAVAQLDGWLNVHHAERERIATYLN